MGLTHVKFLYHAINIVVIPSPFLIIHPKYTPKQLK